MVRAFMAIEISGEIRRRIDEALRPLRALAPGVKWVDPENFHLTLRFLGELPEADVESIRSLMKARFEGAPAPAFRVVNIGKFPEHGHGVKVIWAGLQGELKALRSLWERAQTCARELGLQKDEHDFSPHVTVGRVRTPGDTDALGRKLLGFGPVEFGAMTAGRVVLFQSTLQPQGPVYTPIFSVPLPGPTPP